MKTAVGLLISSYLRMEHVTAAFRHYVALIAVQFALPRCRQHFVGVEDDPVVLGDESDVDVGDVERRCRPVVIGCCCVDERHAAYTTQHLQQLQCYIMTLDGVFVFFFKSITQWLN